MAGLIGVGTGIGLVLLVLVMLAMRAGSGSADIGIGNLSVYQPSIDPVALLAIAAVTTVVGVAAAFVPAAGPPEWIRSWRSGTSKSISIRLANR